MNQKGAVNKGKAGERELANLLDSWTSGEYTIRRNLVQARSGGFDLEGLPHLAVEAKRREQLALPAWWRQTVAQSKMGGCFVACPLLAYRQNRKPWYFIVTVNDWLRYKDNSMDPLLQGYELLILGREKTKVVRMNEDQARAWLNNYLVENQYVV